MWEEPVRGKWEGSQEDLMRACACTQEEVCRFFEEVVKHDFAHLSRNCASNVTIINRRMHRDTKVRKNNTIRVQQHRARKVVTLLSHDGTPSFLFLLLFLYPPPRPYPPFEGTIVPSSSPALSCPVDDIVEIYHKLLPMLPRVRSKGKKLKARLGARWKEYGDLQWWEEYFRFVAESRFLTGQKTDWSANLFWLTGPENMEKVLNNSYHRDQKGMSRYTAQNLEALRNWKEKE
jgi:hypothetical protein